MQRPPQLVSSWDRPHYRTQSDVEEGDNLRSRSGWEAPVRREHRGQFPSDLPKGIKMDPPYFDGSDTASWIAHVQYYFDHLGLPDADRLHYVVMLFPPPASKWIFNYRANNRFVTWNDFLEDVRHRFDPQSFRNFIGPLSKLVQTGSVAEYQATFEHYSNRIESLSESALIPMFIAGLKEPIQEKVEWQQPASLATAMALALRLAKSQDEENAQFQWTRWHDTRSLSVPTANPSPSTTSSQPSGRSDDRSMPKPICVSATEKAEHAKRGLCFYCPEKWVQGHVCKTKLLAYFGEDEDDTIPQDDERATDDTLLLMICPILKLWRAAHSHDPSGFSAQSAMQMLLF